MRKKLQLIISETENETTKKLYEITKETCDRFNYYYLDFHESVEILTEKLESEHDKNSIEAKELIDEIDYMKNKIEELKKFMLDIATKMPGLVELIDAE
jgi:hypothetical protein